VSEASAGVEALGIDVGGTKIACLRVDQEGGVSAREVVPTPAADPDATIAAVVSLAERLRTPATCCVGMGAAGMVDSASGILRYSPNLAWRELPIADRVGSALGLPVGLDNDANVAAWGEFRRGAGRGLNHMLLVTVGTGIGAGMVLEGKLFRGAHGLGGEAGHVIVDPDGPICGCGNHGCWEQVASGRAIERSGRAAIAEHPQSLMAQMVGGDASKLTGPMVTEAAARDDDVAKGILADVGRRLGAGIAGLVNVLDTEAVVVGGGAIAANEMLLAPARAAFVACLEAPSHRPAVPILGAELGNDAGAIGAALLALDRFPG
jgi:glucokinase